VAEGVETKDQLARLTSLGCSSVQGYYFSKPVDAERAQRLLRDGETLLRAILLKPALAIEGLRPSEAEGSEPVFAGAGSVGI
jgi:hypothetical protein